MTPSSPTWVWVLSDLRNSPRSQPEPTDYDYEYRVDTDVITPVTLYAGSEINPDGPATVTFTIKGSTYRMNNIVIPEGDSQLAG